MKVLISFFILLLSACQSFDFDEYAVLDTPELDHKLPHYHLSIKNPTIVMPGSSGYLKSTERDYRAIINSFFIKEFEDKVIDITKPVFGNMELIPHIVVKETGIFKYAFPSGITLFTICLLGFPATEYTANVSLELRITDKHGAVLHRYTAKASDSELNALYYGYYEDDTKVAALTIAYKTALSDLIKQIKSIDNYK